MLDPESFSKPVFLSQGLALVEESIPGESTFSWSLSRPAGSVSAILCRSSGALCRPTRRHACSWMTNPTRSKLSSGPVHRVPGELPGGVLKHT